MFDYNGGTKGHRYRLNPYDMLLLEYPYAPPADKRLEEYFEQSHPIRRVPFLRTTG